MCLHGVFVCLGEVRVQIPWHMSRCQRKTLWSWFSSSIFMWISCNKLGWGYQACLGCTPIC